MLQIPWPQELMKEHLSLLISQRLRVPEPREQQLKRHMPRHGQQAVRHSLNQGLMILRICLMKSGIFPFQKGALSFSIARRCGTPKGSITFRMSSTQTPLSCSPEQMYVATHSNQKARCSPLMITAT